MAAITPQVIANPVAPDKDVAVWLWETITTTNNVGTAVKVAEYKDLTIQVIGNFSGSATISLQGSIDGTNFATLPEYDGTAATLAAAGITGSPASPLYVRPAIGSGDGSADLDVYLVARK